MEFEATMMPVLTDCSRQKLRSFHMNLLKYGSNVNERITSKEVVAAFQESSLKLPGRALQLISEVYTDSKGVDFGRLYRRLEMAQGKTRRDSVLARQLVGDRSQYNQISEDVKDADLLRRIEEQLLQCPHYFELESYRAACLKLDLNKSGKLPLEQMSELARTDDLPVYGALLTNLLNRCDDEKNGSVSWPEFMNFLFKAMDSYCTKNPDKPKPGTNRPKIERDEALSNRRCLAEVADLNTDKERRSSRGAELVHRLTDKVKGGANVSLEGTTPNSVYGNSLTKKAANDVSVSDGASGPPVKEYMIRGQPVRLVVPADLINGSESNCDPPTQRLKLDWVYGYSGRVRHNAYIVSNGDLMYSVAHVVVLLDMQGDLTQRHYKEHTSIITCLSVHSDKVQVASGQSRYLLSPAQIRVWRSDSLQTLCVLEDKAYIVNCYTHLTFCVLQGKSLTSIDRDTREIYGNQLLVGEQREAVHVSVWDISSQSKIAQTPLNTLKLCSLQFNPVMPLLVVTLGREHFQWWRLDRERGKMDPASEPSFGTAMRARQYQCSYHTPSGDLVTGDSNGTIYVWPSASNNLTNLIKHAHEGSIVSTSVVSNTLITCGTDGFLRMWKYGYHMDKLLELRLPDEEGHVTTLLHKDGMLLLGTSSNSLISYSVQLNSLGHVTDVTSDGSFAMGVSGEIISTIPLRAKTDQFICVGSSGRMVVYDSNSRALIGCDTIKGVAVSSVDACESTESLVIGCQTGRLLVMNMCDLELEPAADLTVSRSKVSHVSFCPSGAMIAAVCKSTIYFVGERDGEGGEKEWRVVGKVKIAPSSGEPSYVDWSVEKVNGSHLLRVYCDQSLQIILYDSMKLCEVMSLEPLHICSWTSHKCPLSFLLAGIWYSKQCVETGPLCIDVDSQGKLVAVCSRQGYLCLFQHPCTKPGAFSHTYRCHVQPSHVSFTSNDLVLTSGAADVCIMQWKIV